MNPLYLKIGAVLLGLIFIGAVGAAYWFYQKYKNGVDDELDELLEENDEVAFDPPEVKNSPLDYFRVMRHYQRAKKLAKKGYVRWYVLDSTMSRPQWIKPEQEGTGVAKYKDGDQPYYFTKEAMVADELTGAWTALHREGEADPVNLRDPAYPGIETDLVERIINLEAENEPSTSLLGLGGLSTQQLMWLGIGALFIVFAGVRYMG